MPASWVTSSGCPEISVTCRRGRSAVASTAAEPPTIRTRSATTPSKSSVVGESIVQRVIARLLPLPTGCMRQLPRRAPNKRYISFTESQAPRRLPARPAHRGAGPRPIVSLLVVLDRGQPVRQPVHRALELGVQVDELAQPVG